jgi:hypothetical protein
MIVRQNRLLNMLREHGFACGPESRTSNDLIFTRPSHIESLFESIIVGGQGKRGEAVSAEVGVAVTKWVMYKALGDVKFLDELGEDPQRGWTIIKDDSKARHWEARLAEVGPVRAKEWADARGPRLLQETAQARAAADKYLTLLEPMNDLEQKLVALKKASSEPIAEEAERLSACPIFGDGPDAELAYRVACHVILSHSEEVDGQCYFGRVPMNDPPLLERIEILADKLLHGAGPHRTTAL